MVNHTQAQKNIAIIKQILANEVAGDVRSALAKMHDDYRMVWVYKNQDGVRFPATQKPVEEIKDVYKIKGREYRINRILGDDNCVIAEITESYPAPNKSGIVYRTPMTIVWEFKGGKIHRGRHYCDPRLSFDNITTEDIDNLYTT